MSQTKDTRKPSQMALSELFREDLETHDRDLLSPGLWALTAHRIGHRYPHRRATKFISGAVDWLWGINITHDTTIGRRLRIWHFGSIVIDAASIGNDVHIRHLTTMGETVFKEAHGLPTIGDRVEIGAGAAILGPVRVGSDAIVGPNSVVMSDVDAKTGVFGVPARAVK